TGSDGWLVQDRVKGHSYLVQKDATGTGMTVYATTNITADAGGLTIALNLGAKSTVGISVGIAAAVNNITDTTQAFVADSTVGGTSVDIAATSATTIDAVTIGGVLEATLGKGDGFQGDGAGAGSGNTINDTVASYIKDRDAADTIATSVTASSGA